VVAALRPGVVPSGLEKRRLGSSLSHARARFDRLVLPRVSGLPNLIVLLVIPALLFVVIGTLCALGISGSSTGVYWTIFGSGADPSLLLGGPRAIRSDEWLVQSSWVVSQVQQGFPVINQTFPGGMDSTVQNDLPSWDWSTLFRPHVWGYLLFPLDQGMAVRWWLPALALVTSAYVFVVSVLPKRPITAAMLALGLLYSPIFQWWFLPTTLWPVAFAFAAMTALIWMFKTQRRWVNYLWAAVTGYLAVATAMSIYVPFMVPAIYVIIFFAVGAVVSEKVNARSTVAEIGKRFLPLAVAAVGALVVMGLWIITRLETITDVTSTVYPGQRLEKTGTLDSLDKLANFFSGPFQRALQGNVSGILASNQSESAAPLLLVVFLLIALVWAAFGRARTRVAGIDWMLLSVAACTLFVIAFLAIPNWDTLAHLLAIDRTVAARTRLAFAVLGVVGAALLLRRIEQTRAKIWWPIALVSASLVIVATAAVSQHLRAADPEVLAAGNAWIVVTALLAATVLLLCRGQGFFGAATMLLASLLIGFYVNPFYLGVFDLRETAMGEEIAQIREIDEDSEWVGVGGFVPTAMLVESGVRAYNGMQTSPSDEMWDEIDPDGEYAFESNRLANVNWMPGTGEPTVSLPVRDQILVTFDSCSEFGQENVDYVLSDTQLAQPCLIEYAQETEGSSTLWIYEVSR
jgi:hypothetical protein